MTSETPTHSNANKQRSSHGWGHILISVFVYCFCCLIMYGIMRNTSSLVGESTSTTSSLGDENIIGVAGLIIMFIGVIYETIASCFHNHPKIQSFFESVGALFLIVGGIVFLVSIFHVVREVAQSCTTGDDDNEIPCYYGGYFGSVCELIAIRSIIIGIFIICNYFNIFIHVFLFACDIGVVGGFMVGFMVQWYQDYDGTTNIEEMYDIMLFGFISYFVIPFYGLIVVFLIQCNLLPKSMKFAYIGSLWIIICAICVFGGIIYGTSIGAFLDTMDYGIIFSMLYFGLALFVASIKYSIMVIIAANKVIDGNSDNDVKDNAIDLSIIDNTNVNSNGNNYLKLSAVV